MKTYSFLTLLLLVSHTLPLRAQTAPQVIWTTNAHASYVLSVAFSGNSERLASGSPDGDIKIWARATNELLQSVFAANAKILSVALSSDGSLVGGGG